jgi:hypothetical protein
VALEHADMTEIILCHVLRWRARSSSRLTLPERGWLRTPDAQENAPLSDSRRLAAVRRLP